MNTWSNKLKNYIYFKWELFLESKWKVPCLSFFETIRLMMIIICFVISSYDICALRTLETTTTSKAIDVALFLFIVASWCKIHPLTPKPNQPTNHRRNPMTTHQARPQIPLFPPLKIDCLTYTLHETSKHSTWKKWPSIFRGFCCSFQGGYPQQERRPNPNQKARSPVTEEKRWPENSRLVNRKRLWSREISQHKTPSSSKSSSSSLLPKKLIININDIPW